MNLEGSTAGGAAGSSTARRRTPLCCAALLLAVLGLGAAAPLRAAPETAMNGFLEAHCGHCHNDIDYAGNWSLADFSVTAIARGEELAHWELVLTQTRDGTMPPLQRRRSPPTAAARAGFVERLEAALDARARAHPDPGRSVFRRLNRAEYANAVRDVLQLDVDLRPALPADDSGYGFDNIADLLSVSGTLVDRYFAAAERASRLATGLGATAPERAVHQVPKAGSILNQGIPSHDRRAHPRLPIDSRGGDAFLFHAPQSGEYDISGYLNANTNNEVDRLAENRYGARVRLDAGPHWIGMSFRKRHGLDERVQTLRNTTDIVPMPSQAPLDLQLDVIVDGVRAATLSVPSYHMSERFAQQNFLRDVLQIDVEGPFNATGSEEAPAYRHLFSCHPRSAEVTEPACAAEILGRLQRIAFRRPIDDADLQPLLRLFESARQDNRFEVALATAIQALLLSPSFLFVAEPPDSLEPAGAHQRISDTAFATRLALFLWSSVPDATLLDLAGSGRLREPDVLREQVRRMLRDERASALTHNFAGQWLFLRNLEHHRPDVMLFPDFDEPLRQSMRAETETFFSALLRDNASLLELIDSDYTYLNERLARHYGIDGIRGTQLRRVNLAPDQRRGGVLGQASLLTLTSYGNHTSVVRRGQWILDSLLAAPPPPPPPDVPALVARKEGRALTAREQLALHREDPACAACHVRMDPLGLALENYDAVGAFRTHDNGHLIDPATQLPDGTAFAGLAGLQRILLARKDQFTRAFTEQLLTYALGRGIEAVDRPTIRAIARAAAADDYRIHSVVLGIAASYPFNHRRGAAQ